jgi:hypothetical protein
MRGDATAILLARSEAARAAGGVSLTDHVEEFGLSERLGFWLDTMTNYYVPIGVTGDDLNP